MEKVGDQDNVQQAPVQKELATEPTDHSLLRELRGGSEDAAAELYDRYALRLHQLAKAHCSPDLAIQVGVEDIVQSIFASFFRRAQTGYYDVPKDEELWSLFLVIALNKIRAKAVYHHAAKRDSRRKAAAEEFEITLEKVAAKSESAQGALRLVVDDVLSELTKDQRQAIELRMEGYNVREIASQIKRSKRTCERLLQDAKSRLAEIYHKDD